MILSLPKWPGSQSHHSQTPALVTCSILRCCVILGNYIDKMGKNDTKKIQSNQRNKCINWLLTPPPHLVSLGNGPQVKSRLGSWRWLNQPCQYGSNTTIVICRIKYITKLVLKKQKISHEIMDQWQKLKQGHIVTWLIQLGQVAPSQTVILLHSPLHLTTPHHKHIILQDIFPTSLAFQ